MRASLSSAFLLSLAVAGLSFSAEVLAEVKIPGLSGPVMDQGDFLSATEKRNLAGQLRSYSPTTQIQIWTLPSLEGESIEDVSIRAVEQWKLGDEKLDNGVLIIAAKKERRMRIEVGQGLEAVVPDILAGRIIDYIMQPAFREGDFYGGFSAAATKVFSLAKGEIQDIKEPRQSKKKASIFELLLYFVLMIFAIVSRAIFPFRGRQHRGVRSSSGFGGGIRPGGFGGGGFGGWSGGGGGFSGGGASGGW